MDDIIHCSSLDVFILPCVSYIKNEGIVAIPSNSEIFDVFKGLNPAKSPGLDVMSTAFFQNFRNIVGPNVCNVIQNVFSFGRLPMALNRTFVILIPKVKQIYKFNHICPISLCNTIYKVISKLLASIIKLLLSRISSPNQSISSLASGLVTI